MNIKFRFLLGWALVGALALAVSLASGISVYKVTTGDYAKKSDIPKKADLGNENLVQLACDYATVQAVNQGVVVRKCEASGKKAVKVKENTAEVSIFIQTNIGNFDGKVLLQKSLWTVTNWGVYPSAKKPSPKK